MKNQANLTVSILVSIGACIIAVGIFFIGGAFSMVITDFGTTKELVSFTVFVMLVSFLMGFGAGYVFKAHIFSLLIGVLLAGLGVTIFTLWENLVILDRSLIPEVLPVLGMIFASCIGISLFIRLSN